MAQISTQSDHGSESGYWPDVAPSLGRIVGAATVRKRSARPGRPACKFLLLLPLLLSTLQAQTHYEIDLAEAQSGWLKITVETACPAEQCDFQMPVWSATYQIRDFAKFVQEFRARGASKQPLDVTKVNPSRWRIRTQPGQNIKVRYRILADRPGPFGAYAGAEHVCLNLAQVLAYPVDNRGGPFTVRFRNAPGSWKTALSLPAKNGRYHAPNYQRLIDTPAHLSDFDETEFTHAGRTVRVVAHPRGGDFNLRLLRQTAQKVVSVATAMMDETPFDSYTFVYHFSDLDGGGMEYRNGTSIWGPGKCSDCRMNSLTAHEFFHLWNVKRIRPRSLEPIDFTQPNITPSLWFAEGVTSTYAEYIQLRAGLTSEADFLGRLGRSITKYEARPASVTQSAEESSIDAWLERYPAYGRGDRSISYYMKGQLIGYLLDLTIRRATLNRRGLDHVMRTLNQEYARRGRFYEDTDAIERIASRVAGRDLAPEFRELVRTAEPIAWDQYFGLAGYRLDVTESSRLGAGLTLSDPPGIGVVVSSIEPGGPGEQAGFRRGDRIYRVNRSRITSGAAEVEKRLTRGTSRKVAVAIERDGAPMTLELQPREVIEKVYQIVELEDPTNLQLKVRRGWLEGRTEMEHDGELPSH